MWGMCKIRSNQQLMQLTSNKAYTVCAVFWQVWWFVCCNIKLVHFLVLLQCLLWIICKICVLNVAGVHRAKLTKSYLWFNRTKPSGQNRAWGSVVLSRTDKIIFLVQSYKADGQNRAWGSVVHSRTDKIVPEVQSFKADGQNHTWGLVVLSRTGKIVLEVQSY